jgi:hypothetical protein
MHAEQNDLRLKTEPAVFYTYADLIEEEDQSELMSIRDMLSACYFRIGDIALKYVHGNARKNSLRVNVKMIYEAVGFFVGRSGRTVRYYAENAVFYEPDVRDTYKELPFAYFDLARNFGDHWRDVLEYASENMGVNYDKIEIDCRRAFIWDELMSIPPSSNPVQETESFQEEDEIHIPLCERPTIEINADRPALLSLLHTIDELATKVERAERRLDLPEHIQMRLLEGVKAMRDCIPAISALAKRV